MDRFLSQMQLAFMQNFDENLKYYTCIIVELKNHLLTNILQTNTTNSPFIIFLNESTIINASFPGLAFCPVIPSR